MTGRASIIMRSGWCGMVKTKIRVMIDKVAVIGQIKAASDAALTAVGVQALMDASQYVPKDQGTLENSEISDSDQKAQDGLFVLCWSTPYAQYLWHGDVMYGNPSSRTYGPEKLSFTSALAREEWAKYAYEVHGEEWEQVYQAALKRGMEG